MYNEVIDSFTGLKWNVAAILDLCQLRSKPAGRFWPNSSIMMMDIYIYISERTQLHWFLLQFAITPIFWFTGPAYIYNMHYGYRGWNKLTRIRDVQLVWLDVMLNLKGYVYIHPFYISYHRFELLKPNSAAPKISVVVKYVLPN